MYVFLGEQKKILKPSRGLLKSLMFKNDMKYYENIQVLTKALNRLRFLENFKYFIEEDWNNSLSLNIVIQYTAISKKVAEGFVACCMLHVA
jgi:hypothetical protein